MNELDTYADRALSSLSAQLRHAFLTSPLSALRDGMGLTVTAVDHLAETRADGGACDGLSFLKDGVVLYAATPYSRRENFTLAHEVGHYLVDQSSDVYDWLADQDEPGRVLETICDRIAAQLLLPERAAKNVVKTGPVRAQHLMELYESSEASRPVCAIRLAKMLPGLGAIAILDAQSGTVTHASVNQDPVHGWPTVCPWPGQMVKAPHPLLRLGQGGQLTRRMSWSTPWGAEAEYYVDAVRDGRHLYLVFSHTDQWGVERFHSPIDRDFDSRPTTSGFCCGRPFEKRGFPCPTCEQAFCPKCGDCRCDRAAKREVACNTCFVSFQPQLLVGGTCIECRS